MNDSFVSPCQPPLQAKNAYILFYCREKGQKLNDVINGSSAQAHHGGAVGAGGGGGGKKRPRESVEGAGAGSSIKGSPSAQSWKGIPNGIGSPSPSSHGPSPAKKQHLQHSNTGPRPPLVLASSALASASTPTSAFPPSDDDDSPTPTTHGKGTFASRATEGSAMSKKEKRLEKKQRKLGIQPVGKMKQGSTVSRMKPRMIK